MSQKITGTLVQSFMICKRQTWLMAHQVTPDQEHSYLEIGRLIDEQSYDRTRKKVHFDNIVLDLVRSQDGDLVVGEIKKSSKGIEGAKMQLAFYLYKLQENGIAAKGQLLFPQERKKINVKLDDQMVEEVENIIMQIDKTIETPFPPSFKKIKYCTHCAYKEFCMS